MNNSQHEIRKQIVEGLNSQYKTQCFKNKHSFQEMVDICQKAIRDSIHRVLYEVHIADVHKYSMSLSPCSLAPFPQHEIEFLKTLGQTCHKIISQPDFSTINQLNRYMLENKLGTLSLNSFYRRLEMDWRYIDIKQAMIFVALSQCNVWYTICKNRKKSNKQFDLDPLIQYFNQFVHKIKILNPFHINILPKKQVKNIQKKINQEKSANPLYEAVANSDYNLAKQLLQNGAKIQFPSFLSNRQKTEVRCTHRACVNKDLIMCKLLHSFGADWEAEDGQKMTPLFYAIQSGSMEVIRYLVQELKVNIQKQQIQCRTPFYWACTQGDINVIDYFYKAGCNVNTKSSLGRTALSKSCYLGRRDIVVYLLGCKQIDMYSQCNKGRTALHNAVFGPKGGRQGHKFGTNEKDSPECAQILLEKGMHVDILDFQFCTSLHIATSSEAIDSIRLLLAYQASLTLKNNYGETPVMTAAKFGHVETCKILYEEYNCDILCIDVFGKNLLLLTAKFQTQSAQEVVNPAFIYFLQPFFKECLKQNRTDELVRTFKQILQSQFVEKMIFELTEIWKGFNKFKVEKPQFGVKEIETIIRISIGGKGKSKNEEDTQFSNLAIDFLKDIKLSPQKLYEIHVWLIKTNEPKFLQFIHDNQLLSLNNMQVSQKQFFMILENDELALKQKVVSFCLLSLNFDWLGYRTEDKCNILHLLVRKQRSGCIVQLFKAFSGKVPPKVLTNKYFSAEQNQIKKALQNLLWQKDDSGLDAHQLSLVLKNKSVAKLIEQKLKQENLQFSSVLDVKDYVAILETDPHELLIFNSNQHEKQEELLCFEEKVKSFGNEQISAWWSFRSQVYSTLEALELQVQQNKKHENFWEQIQSRPLHYIKTQQELELLEVLQKQKVIGIDIEYFNHENITMISIFQISSLTDDYIVDCLSVNLKAMKKYIQPLLYNQNIIKIMHGSDNDLILVKSLFNLSLINFIDTSRLDIELRENKFDLRGLATLTQQYMGIAMSKEYQVSEWRIRPIPKAMLQYAKKDSAILPFLLVKMMDKISNDTERIRQMIVGGCKQVRKNKKATQPLISGVRTL